MIDTNTDDSIIEDIGLSAFVSDQTHGEFPIISNKLTMKILKSRTVWTIVILFLINGVSGIHDLIPVNALPVIDGLLGILAIYFRVNTKQNF